jgi:hypothetical protein
VVGKRSEPVVVIMSIKDFLKNIAPEPDVLETIRSEAKRRGQNKASMREIDQEIAAYRQEKKR